jgi:ABC-type multidrug transport system fused ATPase/permease subunit
LGEKLAQLIYSLAILFGGLVIALVRGPIFALICLAYTPFFVFIIACLGLVTKKAQIAKLGQLENLGAHTEETLSALKLIISFAQEDITLKKYDNIATETKVISKKAVRFQGMMGCMFMFSMFGFYIYAYGVASALLEHHVNNPLTSELYSIAEIVAVS